MARVDLKIIEEGLPIPTVPPTATTASVGLVPGFLRLKCGAPFVVRTRVLRVSSTSKNDVLIYQLNRHSAHILGIESSRSFHIMFSF